jgi:hypothetical protein
VPTLNLKSGESAKRFVFVMVLSFVLGVVVGWMVFFLWRSHPADFQHWSAAAAFVICPPFVLSYAIGAAPDSAFALVLGVGTILFANGFLYAGVAAGIYAVVTVLAAKRKTTPPQMHGGHREE